MTAAPAPAPAWRVRNRILTLDRPTILGVLNVTPDSFSDGGQFFSTDEALARAEHLLAEGADILDIGGESTRPQGATSVDVTEERRRVVPVVREVRRRWPDAVISIDTVKSEVAAAVLAEGADVVNDVAGFRLDPHMAPVCAAAGAGVILMHSRGGVSDMGTYTHATYRGHVIDEVLAELGERVRAALHAGIRDDAIAVDPGIGFAKRTEHSLALLADLHPLVGWGYPVVVGVSRKRFIGEITGVKTPSNRALGTVGANVMALAHGVRLFRVHDVRPSREALDVAWAIIRTAMHDDHEQPAC
jgi:dihydropteroate synthase